MAGGGWQASVWIGDDRWVGRVNGGCRWVVV